MGRVVMIGAVVVLAGLVAAGCGGGDDSSVNASGASTTASTVPPSTAPTTIAPETTTSVPASTTSPSIPPGTVVVNPLVTTTAPPITTTAEPPTTSTTTPNDPAKKQAAILQKKLLAKVGPSNRGVPDAARFAVVYVPGSEVTVTWAVNNGAPPLPTGTPTCDTTPPTSVTAKHSVATSSTTKREAANGPTTTTTVDPAGLSTRDLARYEAKQIILVTKSRLGHLDFDDVRLVGEYPLSSPTDGTIVDVSYTRATVQTPKFTFPHAFEVPPAQKLTCIDPAFQ